MGYVVEITTKNAWLDIIKTWGPPILTLLLGFVMGSGRDWQRYRREIRNMRLMIYQEVLCIDNLLEEAVNPSDKLESSDLDTGQAYLLIFITNLSFIEAHLEKIGLLSIEEVICLQKLYFAISGFSRQGLWSEIANKAARYNIESTTPFAFTDDEKRVVEGALKKVKELTSDALKYMEKHL